MRSRVVSLVVSLNAFCSVFVCPCFSMFLHAFMHLSALDLKLSTRLTADGLNMSMATHAYPHFRLGSLHFLRVWLKRRMQAEIVAPSHAA